MKNFWHRTIGILIILFVGYAWAEDSPRNLKISLPGDMRVALVVGNSAYPGVAALKNPINDASDIAAKLRIIGFDVTLATNVGQKEMLRALTELGNRIQPGSEVVFYYAGHGMQVRGKNYLIPIDAEIRTETSVSSEAVDVEQLFDKLSTARLSMVILDACRNNPFENRFRGNGQGLASINAPTGTLIAYSTAPGKVASDGEGRNGLYTQELLAAMDAPGLKVEDVFKRVRANVIKKSGESQTPWESSSLTGDFYFRTAEGFKPAPGYLPTSEPAVIANTQAANALAVELSFWQAAKESNDPTQLQAYLDRYPSGEFASLARRRLDNIRSLSSRSVEPLINALPATSFSASSIWGNDIVGHGPANARYSITTTQSNWSAATNDDNQWLQVDLQRPNLISAIATKGRSHTWCILFSCYPQWVTAYYFAYSLDGQNWQYAGDSQGQEVFVGNFDIDTEVRHDFKVPIRARFLKFYPLRWHEHISMRVEAYGYSVAP